MQSPAIKAPGAVEYEGILSYPVALTTIDRLQQAVEAGEVTNLEELMYVVQGDDDQATVTDDPQAIEMVARIRRTIAVSQSVVRQLRLAVDDGRIDCNGALIAEACDLAFAEAKYGESQRIVPFGAQMTEFCDSIRTMSPSNWSVTLIMTRWFPPKSDGTKNDDYGS